MTSFGKWLGKSNGEAMLSSLFEQDLTKQQAIAVVTTYCLIFDIHVGTNEWNDLMKNIWNYYDRWYDSFSEMRSDMAQFLA